MTRKIAASTAVRNYVRNHNTDVTKVRVKKTGEVEAYGLMPNTNQTGWFFAGWEGEIQQLAARDGEF